MINKIYEQIKDFIKENYLWLIFYLVFTAIMLYPLPYYIYTGGGIINIDDKIELTSATDSKGSYNMCFVSEINATIPTYLLSYIIPSWDLVSKNEVTINNKETKEDILTRDHLYLLDANQSAVLTAFSNSEADYQIKTKNYYVLYIDEKSDTDLKIGDQILAIDGITIENLEEIGQIIQDKEVGDRINISVINKQKKVNRYGVIREENNQKVIGISITTIYEYETNPSIKFHFTSRESGPSGGLMLSLALYDKLVAEDITKGYKISGTGTIDMNGKVGNIGGVKYKLKGAVKAHSDIFIVPSGENYEEAIKLKEKYHYNIKIIGVSTFEEAIEKLTKI